MLQFLWLAKADHRIWSFVYRAWVTVTGYAFPWGDHGKVCQQPTGPGSAWKAVCVCFWFWQTLQKEVFREWGNEVFVKLCWLMLWALQPGGAAAGSQRTRERHCPLPRQLCTGVFRFSRRRPTSSPHPSAIPALIREKPSGNRRHHNKRAESWRIPSNRYSYKSNWPNSLLNYFVCSGVCVLSLAIPMELLIKYIW